MWATLQQCWTRGERKTGCCDLTGSIFGEDAFYRDAFYDCQEGNRSHDRLFAIAREQAKLKMRKGSVFAKYASFEIKQSAASFGCLTSPKFKALTEADERSKPTDSSRPWLGRTIPHWTGAGSPATGEGPYWSRGEGIGLKVRRGPNYKTMGQKEDSKGSMYETICCDTIKADSKIDGIIGRLVRDLPPPPESHSESDRGGGGGTLQWTSGCPLPRVICIHMMLPYEAGITPWKTDPGCSFVGFFHIKPETLLALRSQHCPPHVQLFKDFCEGPAGAPTDPVKDPSRSLHQRVAQGVKKDQQAGLFKAIAHCINPEAVHVPDMFHTYNGKPCLITKCGYIVKDPAGEWLEIGVDVRGFNILARKMLRSFRNVLPQTKIHYGFLIQGVEDAELPEVLLCDMYLHGINMMTDPVTVGADGDHDGDLDG